MLFFTVLVKTARPANPAASLPAQRSSYHSPMSGQCTLLSTKLQPHSIADFGQPEEYAMMPDNPPLNT